METVVTLADSLGRIGSVEVHVLTRSTRIRQERRETVGNLSVTWVADPWASPDYLIGRSLLRGAFAKSLARIKPDIVHGHGEPPFIRAALDHSAPGIITLQGIFAEQTRAHGKKAPLAYRAAYALMRRWEASYLRQIQSLIAINSHIAEYVRARSPNVDIAFIKNPVDRQFFEVPDLEVKPTILFVGQVTRRKGADLLLAAFDRIAVAHPQSQVRIVGDLLQDPAYVAALQSQYASYIGSGRVVFAGPGKRSVVRRELSECSLLCLPSYYEASPVAVIEAMAAAKPVVATRVGDVSELVGDTGAGTVIDPGDVDQLVAALDSMLRDSSARKSIGQRAREAARRRAAPDAVAEQTLKAYERAIGIQSARF